MLILTNFEVSFGVKFRTVQDYGNLLESNIVQIGIVETLRCYISLWKPYTLFDAES